MGNGAVITVELTEENGVTTLVFSLTIQVAEVGFGYKSAMILADFLILSYLFFFNSWFRNRLVFRTYQRMTKD